jgi:outer membrane protein assembly factor BamA
MAMLSERAICSCDSIVSSISIEGNQRTKNYVILREFPLKVGNILNINEVDKGMNNIYSSNLFKTVSFELTNIHNQAKVVLAIYFNQIMVLIFQKEWKSA